MNFAEYHAATKTRKIAKSANLRVYARLCDREMICRYGS